MEILRDLAWAACPHGGSPHAARWFLADGSGWFPAQAWRIRGCSWYLLRGLRRFPDFVPAQKHLASLYAANPEKRGQAYDLVMKARKALPDDPELAQILAELSFQRKEFAYAVQLLQRSPKEEAIGCQASLLLGDVSLGSRREAPESRRPPPSGWRPASRILPHQRQRAFWLNLRRSKRTCLGASR